MCLIHLFKPLLLCTLAATPCLAKAGAVTLFVNEELSHAMAMRQLATFPEGLSEQELALCLRFLERPFDPQEQSLLIVRQNDLADWLLQRPATVGPALRVLLAVLEEGAAGLQWQDYCLQKLPLAYEQPSLTEDLQAQVIHALRHYVRNPQSSFSGTALLGLYRLRASAPMETAELIEMAHHILEHSAFATANQVTALQLAVLLGDPVALEQARRWIADEDTAVQLRVSAIASVGSKGSAADAARLEPLLKDPDLRLRRASRAALAKLPTY